MNNNDQQINEKRSYSKSDFEALYSEYHQRVLDFVAKRVGFKEVAEDLTSEIFEKIYKSINDFQWQGVTIAAWIFRIARNRIIDYYRTVSKSKNDASIYDLSN